MPQLHAVAGLPSLFNQECIAPNCSLLILFDVTNFTGKRLIRMNASQEKAVASTNLGS